jgi:hypothetical protein
MKSVRADRHQQPPSAAKCTSREPFHFHKSNVAVASQGVITRTSWRLGGTSALIEISVSHMLYPVCSLNLGALSDLCIPATAPASASSNGAKG